jgi:digeranylgeranylglycerophospholipid reductase
MIKNHSFLEQRLLLIRATARGCIPDRTEEPTDRVVNSRDQYDAVVVGAGPSGSAAARWIAARGFSVLLVEEHQQVGYPNHCAGLITPRTLTAAGLDAEDGLVENRFRGAIINSASGSEYSIGGDRVHALAIDRPKLDVKLADEAQEAGVRLLLHTRASHFERHPGGLRVHLDNEHRRDTVETRLLIGADGARSEVGSWAQLPGPDEVIHALNVRVRLPASAPDFVEVFVGEHLAPGWFAWVIPLGDGQARLGIGTDTRSPGRCFNEWITAFPDRFRNMEILDMSGGSIPLGLPKRAYSDNVMLVGDAACQVKPTSGGGLYTGLRGASSCAQVAADALGEDDLSAASLKRYHDRWLGQMGEELELGMLLRRVFTSLEDKDFERVLRWLGNRTIQQFISEYGDIDFPSRLFKESTSFFPGLAALSALGIRIARRDEWIDHALAVLRTSG